MQSFIISFKFNHCLRGGNVGGSPHEDSSFILVAEMGLIAIKGKEWDFIEWKIVEELNSCSHFIKFILSKHHVIQVLKIDSLFPLVEKSGPIFVINLEFFIKIVNYLKT